MRRPWFKAIQVYGNGARDGTLKTYSRHRQSKNHHGDLFKEHYTIVGTPKGVWQTIHAPWTINYLNNGL